MFNPNKAVGWFVWVPFAVLGVGALTSAGSIAEASKKASDQGIALARATTCAIAMDGPVVPGEVYVTRIVVPGKPGGEAVSETILAPGTTVCHRGGTTAQVSDYIASFSRLADPKELGKALDAQFEVDENGKAIIPPERQAWRSKSFPSMVQKRPPIKVPVKKGWFPWG